MSPALSPLAAWLSAFAFTQAVEVPIYFALTKAAFSNATFTKRVLIAFGASLITHPFVWFVFPLIFQGYATYLVTAESFAVIVEALYLRAFAVKRSLLISLLANGASLGLGLLSREVFGWP